MTTSPATSHRVVALLVALVMTACQPAAEVTTPTVTETTTTTTTVAPTPTESQVFEVLAVKSHPNGTQLRVERIEMFEDSVVVSGAVTNGSRLGLTIGQGRTELVSDTAESASLLEPMGITTLGPADEMPFTLRFGALAEPSTVTLILNAGQGASPINPDTNTPSFELGPIVLDPAGTRPALPDPVPIRRSAVSPSGIEFQIEGINFADNRIGVWVRISNPLALEARISPSIAPSLIVDDLGTRYPLVLPEGESWISIPPGTARSGVLSFSGRIHPDTQALNLAVNAGTAGPIQNRVYPELIAMAIPLAGEAVTAPLPDALEIATDIGHPAGVRVRAAAAVFTDTGMEVPVVIANNRGEAVAMAGSPTRIVDDLDNAYPVVALLDNPQLVVAADTTIEATLVFSGRVADDATLISLQFNAGQSPDDPSTRQPFIGFGPFELQRSGAAPPPVEARLFAVGTRSRLVEDELAVSQIDQISQTLTQFGAIEVDGGFQLTLPDSILFDFGSAELRADAAQALSLIADVLEYFEGDPVIVVGHTDPVGGAAANQRLSELRAQHVVDTLVTDHGIASERLSAEGRGSTEPVVSNTTPAGADDPEGRQRNRRVEIVVLTIRPLP